MVEFRGIIVSLLLAGLFIISLINVGYYLSLDSGANDTIMDSPVVSSYYNSLNDKIGNQSYDITIQADNSTSSSDVTFASSSPFLESINGVWKTIKTIPTTIYSASIGFITSTILSGPETVIITTTISTILIITIIFAVWKWIATGEGG